MKIRTDFVTNSSSYSSAEIKIDNPVLLDILQRYREMGAFETGNFYSPFEALDIGHKNLAVNYINEENSDVRGAPDKLEDVLEFFILGVLETMATDGPVDDWDLYRKCKKELLVNKQRILEAYKKVVWKSSTNAFGEFEPQDDEERESEWSFYYKKR